MLKKLILLVLASSFALEASAIMIVNHGGVYDQTEVGGLDQIVTQTGKKVGTGALANSKPKTETEWANSILEPEVEFTLKAVNVDYYSTDVENIFAFELYSDPAYYIIKNAKYWALFENTGSSGWAVFNASDLFKKFNLGDSKSMEISHVSELKNVSAVPVPASLPLFGLALGLFAWVRRRRLI